MTAEVALTHAGSATSRMLVVLTISMVPTRRSCTRDCSHNLGNALSSDIALRRSTLPSRGRPVRERLHRGGSRRWPKRTITGLLLEAIRSLRCASARKPLPVTHYALAVGPKHADIAHSLLATEKRQNLRGKAVRRQEADSEAFSRHENKLDFL